MSNTTSSMPKQTSGIDTDPSSDQEDLEVLNQPDKPVAGIRWGHLFRSKWISESLPDAQADLTGRTVVITGANSGLGFEAAKKFYDMQPAGPKLLILAVRSIERGEEAKKAIVDSSNDSNGREDRNGTDVQVWQLDLCSFDSVKAFAARANKELDRLDVLLENAGIYGGQFKPTADGWEPALQTNVISTFMLATLLLPLLFKTAKLPAPVSGVDIKPHLAILTSALHSTTRFPQKTKPNMFAAANDKDQYQPRGQYPTTKLMVLLLTRQLAKVLQHTEGGTSVVLSAVEPGFCRSGLTRDAPALIRSIMYGIFGLEPSEGAKNLVWASVTNDIPSGSYIDRCEVVTTLFGYASQPESIPTQAKLWRELGEIIVPLAPETKMFWH